MPEGLWSTQRLRPCAGGLRSSTRDAQRLGERTQRFVKTWVDQSLTSDDGVSCHRQKKISAHRTSVLFGRLQSRKERLAIVPRMATFCPSPIVRRRGQFVAIEPLCRITPRAPLRPSSSKHRTICAVRRSVRQRLAVSPSLTTTAHSRG
jgi:hypothetical protein